MEEDYSFAEMVPEEPTNRTFRNFAIILIVAILISVIAGALWIFVLSPARQEARNAQATETAAELTQVALAQIPTETFTPWPTNTPPATIPPTATRTVESPAQVSSETATVTPGIVATFTPTATALPDTGFADDMNLPGLVALGLILVMVTFAARQIRVGLTN